MPNVPTTPFGVFLADRKLDIDDLPLPLRNVARNLRSNRTNVPPNSPILGKLADHLKVPHAELAKFAEGEPMGEKWVRKITTQLERGTIPRGKQLNSRKRAATIKRRAAERDEPERPKQERHSTGSTPFAKLAVSKGFTVTELAKRLGVPEGYMFRISSGNVARNHPALDVLARLLKVDVAQLRRMMNKPATPPGFRARTQKDLLTYMERKGHTHDGADDETPGTTLAVVEVESNGHMPAETRQYNRLGSKRAGLRLRESTRAMVATLNVTVMRGDTHMPPIPVGDLYLILQDYLQEKGIKQIVLVDPSFPNLFDPKG